MRSRNFEIFFWSQFASYIGTGLQTVTLGALVYEITEHSTFWVSMVVFLGLAPSTFLCPTLGGFIGDRYPTRTVMYIIQTCGALQAFILGSVVFLYPRLEYIVACVLFGSLVNSVDSIARHKLMLAVVPNEHIPSAQALNGVMITAGQIVGGSLVGLVFVLTHGYFGAFFLNGLSFIAVLATLHMMRLKPMVVSTESAIRMLHLGAKYIFREKSLFLQLLFSGIFSAVGFSYRGILPAIAREVYGAQDKQDIAAVSGYISAAMAVGSVIGGLIISANSEKLAKILKPLVLFGALTVGVSWIVFPLIHSKIIGLPVFCLFGVGFICCLLGFRSNIKQVVKITRPDMIGRLIGFDFMTFHGGMAFGNLGMGVLASQLGVIETLQIIGIVTILLTVILYYIWKYVQPPHLV